jgi:O-antigen/teichoic acid export membrane protein
MTSARHIARNSLVQFAGRGVTMAISLAVLALLSRYLGPYEFGQYQLVIAFLLLVNISDLGVTTIAIRHLATDRRPESEIMGNILAIRAALALATMLMAIALALIIGVFDSEYSMEATRAIAVASLSFPLMLLSGSYNAIFAAKLRMEFAALGNIAQAVTTLGLMSLVAWTGGGLVRMLLAYDIGFLANSLVCLVFARQFISLRPHFDREYARQVIVEGLPLGVAVVVIAVYSRVDTLLLKGFTGDESVGYYTFAYRAVDLAAPMSLMFIGSIFPILSSHHAADEPEQFRRLYQRAHDLLTVMGISMLTLMILFARPLVDLVGGSAYAPAVASLRILSMAFGLIWLSNLVDHSLIAVGRQHVLFRNACLGLFVNVSANLVLIPMYGRDGAAVATVLTEIAVLLPALYVLRRYIGGVPSFWVAWRLLPVAFVAGGVVYFLELPWFEEAAITCAVLLAGIAAFRVVSLADLRMLLRRDPLDATARV